MRSQLFLRGVILCLVPLVGCDGLLTDYSGSLCNPDGTCIEGYHCVAETSRCELGSVECANVTACVSSDGCCPPGCYANSDNDCPSTCGNAQLEPGEVCDDGNDLDADDCPSTCKPNICGDNFVDQQEPRIEACDDGNTYTESACPYGTAICNKCSADCKTPLVLKGDVCGDGSKDLDPINEVCDDGNIINESTCPYGTPDCHPCAADCKSILDRTGNVCGDGVKDPDGNEACDDGNTSSCGSCSADCKTKTLAYAAGTITAVPSTSLMDGEMFIISDGFKLITFEFDRNGSVTGSRVAIPFSTGTPAAQIAVGIVTAINGVTDPFEIKATTMSGSNIVTLTHNLQGSIGNQAITDTVQDDNFKVVGMRGGGGYDCTEGTKCRVDEDCERGLQCLSGTCTTPP